MLLKNTRTKSHGSTKKYQANNPTAKVYTNTDTKTAPGHMNPNQPVTQQELENLSQNINNDFLEQIHATWIIPPHKF